jgi:ribosomal protein S18 acetylase RimI-like enzyme
MISELPADDVISPVTEFMPDHFAALLAESEASGYDFVQRVVDEWEAGVNCFSGPGEVLFVAKSAGQIVGLCGLNIDPYLGDASVGRVRNVYVLAVCRRRGIGQRLVEHAIAAGRGHFVRLRLRADEAGPARLYESLGFRACAESPDCTHVLEIGRES